MDAKKVTIPEGFKMNSHGGLDPIDLIKEVDLKRDELVSQIVADSLAENERLNKMKSGFFDRIQDFLKFSEKQYGVKHGGKKGNITLMSYDGKYKVVIAVNESIIFDERLQIAKDLIDECIKDWSQGSRSEIQALVQDAFYVGKSGKIDKNRILGLKRLDIKDKKWQKAMQAISDSVKVSGSKQYIRIYQRIEDTDKYDLVNLDIAAL